MRFFKDSSQIVRIRWYPVAEPVECLPFPSKINSLDWSSHPWLAADVGEVYGADRPYNGAKALPYARGLTPCEPAEVFHVGEVYNPFLPPQVYNEDQFPLCCLDMATGRGGVMWDGAATVTLVDTGVPAGASCVESPLIPINAATVVDVAAATGGYVYFQTNFSVATSVRIHFEVLSGDNTQPLQLDTAFGGLGLGFACANSGNIWTYYDGDTHDVLLLNGVRDQFLRISGLSSDTVYRVTITVLP